MKKILAVSQYFHGIERDDAVQYKACLRGVAIYTLQARVSVADKFIHLAREMGAVHDGPTLNLGREKDYTQWKRKPGS